MAALPPLFLVWAGPSTSEATLRTLWQGLGHAGVSCVPLGQHGVAELHAPDPQTHRAMLQCEDLAVDGAPAFVTDRNPFRPPAAAAAPAAGPAPPRPRPARRPPSVFKVCLTGGPCAGKTTVLSTIVGRFNSQGIRTYAVPEAATILITGGLSFTEMTPEKSFRYQTILMQTQLDLEQRFLDIALEDGGPALIVCDRGAMDGKAYCDEPTWARILAALNVDTVQLRDEQYDAVYHMVTAANGAEPFYGAATNAVRRESPEEARELDEKALKCYLGHPHLRIIDNSTDFPRKIERVLNSLAEDMKVAVPTRGSYRRYLVQSPAPTNLPVPTVTIEVEICILQNSSHDCELRLLARGQDHRWSYFLQELRSVGGQPLLTEKRLTHSEYQDRRKQIDRDTEIIQKSSLSFTYRHQYFEMGTFINPAQYRGIALLYIEAGGLNGEPDLPPFIPLEREVTDDPKFSSSAIAQVDYGVLETRTASATNSDAEPVSLERFRSAPTWLTPMLSLRSFRSPPRDCEQLIVCPYREASPVIEVDVLSPMHPGQSAQSTMRALDVKGGAWAGSGPRSQSLSPQHGQRTRRPGE